MSLSDDQQAMLQLVLERGQTYDDLAGVLGVGVDEVRSRARAAMTELAGDDPDAEVGLTDYLLGQADPIGRADAVRQLQNDPDTNRLAAGLVERLRDVAPDATLPDIPEPRRRRAVPRPARPAPDPAGREAAEAAEAAGDDSGEAAGRDGSGLSGGQQRAIVIAGAAALLVIAVVLAVSGVFGGDDSGSTTTTGSGNDNVLADIPLEPQGGSDASGDATFGIENEQQAYLDLQLSELSEPQQQSSYVVWLLLSEKRGYPLTPIEIDGNEFSDRINIPQFAIPLASRARFVDVSLSTNQSLLDDLRKAVRDRKPILPYQGDSVLRGEIPATVGANAGGGGGNGGGGGGGN